MLIFMGSRQFKKKKQETKKKTKCLVWWKRDCRITFFFSFLHKHLSHAQFLLSSASSLEILFKSLLFMWLPFVIGYAKNSEIGFNLLNMKFWEANLKTRVFTLIIFIKWYWSTIYLYWSYKQYNRIWVEFIYSINLRTKAKKTQIQFLGGGESGRGFPLF